MSKIDAERETAAMVDAAVERARQHGAREIRFPDGGVVMVDASGAEHRIPLRDGVRFDPKTVLDYLEDRGGYHGIRNHFGWRTPDNARLVADCKYLLSVRGGVAVLRPDPAPKAILEQVADFDPDDAARLRSLYGRRGIDLRLEVEGQARGAALQATLAGEMRMAGITLLWERRPRQDRSWRALPPFPDIFPEASSDWVFGACADLATARTDTGGGSSARLVESRRPVNHDSAIRAAMAARTDPAVVVQVRLVDSRPVATVTMSPAALALTSDDAPGPWDALRERAAARRPRAPRTWHPTTLAVAHAYVRQEAPRGYVSGRSLYFHGPLAYSEYDSQPVAAMVAGLDGKTVMVFGYARGAGGNGVPTMAMGDIRAALDGRLDVVRVDDLEEIVEIGGLAPSEFARRRRLDKAERDHPSVCTVDSAAVKSWMDDIVAEGEQAVRDAFAGAPYPTLRKVSAYETILRSESVRLAFRDLLGIDLPPACDVEVVTARRDELRAAYDQRKALLDARREDAVAPPGP